MKKWIGSRLNRKLCLCFLIVSLIPLCLVYFYINSRYSEKLRSDAVVLNQLAEKNTAILLEDYLTKIEYISNLFYDNDVQAIVRGAVGPLDNYNARQLLEKKVRVNLDLFHILDDVDQVTFLRHNGDNLDIMNSSGYMDVIPFQYDDRIALNRYKNHVLVPIESLDSSRSGKYVYIRRVNDTDPRKGTLGILYIVFDGNKFDELFAELGTVLETRILIREGEKVLYTSFDAKNGELEQMENTAQLLTQKERMPGRKGLVKWEYGIENLGIHIVFYDTLERLEENVRALSRLTGTFIWLTGIVILAASLFFSRTIVRPVKRLRESLLQVREGDFKVRAQVETHDELGDMCVAFNDMAGEIDRLINQVYTTQLKENEAAIKALQMQINPHFLYNTLDMIKSMSEIYGAYQVSEVIVALSGMFRYAAHSPGFGVTIGEELRNLKNYMKIVNARFGGGIDCLVDVPEELLEEEIIRVCLQPIVENAISHGLGRGGSGGCISVKIRRREDIIFAEVEDDGVGMEPARLEEVRRKLAEPPGGRDGAENGNVGLKNIHDRLRLYYGEEYGITIESILGEGTRVMLSYPCGFSGKGRPQELIQAADERQRI